MSGDAVTPQPDTPQPDTPQPDTPGPDAGQPDDPVQDPFDLDPEIEPEPGGDDKPAASSDADPEKGNTLIKPDNS